MKKLNIPVINPFTDKLIPVYLTGEITKEMPYPNHTNICLGIAQSCQLHTDIAKDLGLSLSESKVSDRTVDSVIQFARENGYGGYWTSAKLQNWLISRQRSNGRRFSRRSKSPNVQPGMNSITR